MQLDDDSLLALYHVYDPEGTGFLSYHALSRQLMDPDCYALYTEDSGTSTIKVWLLRLVCPLVSSVLNVFLVDGAK